MTNKTQYCTWCGPYFGTKFEEAYFFICCTDWIDSTYRRETKHSAFVFLPDKQTSDCVYKTLLEPMKAAEISGGLVASCSNASKRWKKCDEFTSLYQNILKLLFCEHISLLQRKTTPLQIPPHMGKRYAVKRRSRYWQCTCPSPSAHLLGTFDHGNISIPPLRAQNYSTICLLRLHVKFDRISQRTPELEHLPWTAFIRCVWNTIFPIKAPFAKKCFFSDLCIFCLLSSTKSVLMHFVACWKHKQSHIFLSPCRNGPSQLQNCRTKRFLTVFGTLLVTWRQRQEFFSPAHPRTG